MTTATCCPDSKSPETHQYHPLSSGWAFLTRKWKGSPLSEEIRSAKVESVCVVVCPGFEYLYQNTPNNGQHCCLRGRQCCLLSSIAFISSSKEDNAICFLVTSQTWDGHCSWFLSCVSYLDPILGSKKGSQKNFPTCQVKEDLSGQLVRGQPMLIGEPTCNKRRSRIEISVQGHLESYVFLEKGSRARWVLWVHSQRWKQEEEALHISPLRLSGGKSGFLFT